MTSRKTRYVISAPRSGLNWLRFCVEKFYNIPTPGKKVLVEQSGNSEDIFIRSHDPLSFSKGETNSIAWRKVEISETTDACVLLILRDPLEVFVRMANKRMKPFRLYLGNIKFFSEAKTTEKQCVYYEDLISKPEIMKETLEFLKLESTTALPASSIQDIALNWTTFNDESRELYDKNQKRGGGSKTKTVADKFTHHQQSLTQTQKLKVWQFLKRELTTDEFKLLKRYCPSYLDQPMSFLQKCKIPFWRLNWLD